jgi:hypothetical protein
MPEYSVEFHRNGAYAFDQSAISELCRVVRTLTDQDPIIALRFEDDHQIQGSDIETLLNDDEVRNFRLASVDLHAGNFVDSYISITIARDFGHPISIEIQGNKDSVTRARAEIESIIGRGRQWYSWHSIPPPWDFLGGITVWALVSLPLALGVLRFVSPSAGNGIRALIVLPLIWLTFWLMTTMFPKLVFDIGRSAELARRASNVRIMVFVAIALGALVGSLS